MAFSDLRKINPKITVIIRIAKLKYILVFLLEFGLNQTNGRTNGPTHKKDTTRVEMLKYHLSLRAGIFKSS
ncbi:MAG: hypothetical protein M0Q96_01455 [Candidatus Omnitrophica bacterium]|jgi:hypothetical protein|nr:hypothetical protein [Candidatus Omnitrophota bacterium]